MKTPPRIRLTIEEMAQKALINQPNQHDTKIVSKMKMIFGERKTKTALKNALNTMSLIGLPTNGSLQFMLDIPIVYIDRNGLFKWRNTESPTTRPGIQGRKHTSLFIDEIP